MKKAPDIWQVCFLVFLIVVAGCTRVAEPEPIAVPEAAVEEAVAEVIAERPTPTPKPWPTPTPGRWSSKPSATVADRFEVIEVLEGLEVDPGLIAAVGQYPLDELGIIMDGMCADARLSSDLDDYTFNLIDRLIVDGGMTHDDFESTVIPMAVASTFVRCYDQFLRLNS